MLIAQTYPDHSTENWIAAYQRIAFGQHLAELHNRIEALDASTEPGAAKIAAKLFCCCRQPVIVSYTDPERYRIVESRCKSRVCPRCSRIRAKALSHRISDLIHQMNDPRFLTLTIRSNDKPLSEQVKHLRRRFAAMRRTEAWKKHVHQGVYTIEITYNERRKQWHPHVHAIVDGEFWIQADLLALWEKLVNDQAGVDIRAVHGVRKLANYLACYVAKSCDLSKLAPEQLVEWAIETHGLRLAQTFGGLQACKPQTEAAEPLPIELVELDPRDIAVRAEAGSELALDLLAALDPGKRGIWRPSHHATGKLIIAMQRLMAPPKVPPRPAKAQQLYLHR